MRSIEIDFATICGLLYYLKYVGGEIATQHVVRSDSSTNTVSLSVQAGSDVVSGVEQKRENDPVRFNLEGRTS